MSYKPDITPVPIKLSEVKVDFEALVLQLQLLISQKESWTDLQTSSTGQTLIELCSAIGSFNQFAIESAAREAFPDTAYRDSSIYAAARMLGVYIQRKSPSQVVSSLVRPDNGSSLTIPGYSSFTVGGKPYFNRDAISFVEGDLANSVTLYEGIPKVRYFTATSNSFSELLVGRPGFIVSNDDVRVRVVSTTGVVTNWESIDDGIWTAGPTDKVWYHSTTGSGDCSISFGDGFHGDLPDIGSTIKVYWIETNGTLTKDTLPGLKTIYSLDPDIHGTTTYGSTGGGNQKPAAYYKALAPQLFRARRRAITLADYRAVIVDYPGFASVSVQPQREFAPTVLAYMNHVRVCVLKDSGSGVTTGEWATFNTWFDKKKHAAIQLDLIDPVERKAWLNIHLLLKPRADVNQAIAQVRDAIHALFSLQFDTLGKTIAGTDIAEAIKSVDTVDWAVPVMKEILGLSVSAQIYDYIPDSKNEYWKLGSFAVTADYTDRTI